MSQQLELGKVTTYKEREWLVVRVVERSSTLFELPKEGVFVIEESFVQLKDRDGNVEFIILLEERKPFEKQSQIPALEVEPWRK